MPNVGPLELVIVLIIALVVLGPKKLPEVGRSIGRGMREFKGALSADRDDDKDAQADDEEVAAAEPVHHRVEGDQDQSPTEEEAPPRVSG